MFFSFLITLKQYFGTPIECTTEQISSDVLETYCWIHATFTIPNKSSSVAEEVVFLPGAGSNVEGEEEIKYHNYYQWVCLVLYFQAMLIYIPRYLWKNWEGGKITLLLSHLYDPLLRGDRKSECIDNVIYYFITNFRKQNTFAYKYFICELLNFCIVIFQIIFVDSFLDGEFSTYGFKVVSFTEMEFEERVDQMSKVFPTVTKCQFYTYGPSGSIQKFDSLCILPLNIINEKIYVFLWFWFIILFISSLFGLGYRVAVLCNSRVRLYRLCSHSELTLKNQVKLIGRKCLIGDWFLLNCLRKNMPEIFFKEIIEKLYEKLKESPHEGFEELRGICSPGSSALRDRTDQEFVELREIETIV